MSKQEIEKKLMHALKDLKWAKADSSSKFYLLNDLNRIVIPSHVTKVSGSVEKYGTLRPVIMIRTSCIDGVKRNYIGDGQHLFHSLIRLGWDIPYVVVEIDNIKDVVKFIAYLNASSKSWILADYVKSFKSYDENYVKLNKYLNVYDIELSILAGILSNLTIQRGSVATQRIKNGDFVIQDEEKNVKILNQLTDVLKIVPRMNRYENRYLCSEYVNFIRTEGCDYNHQDFMKNLAVNREKFILATQEQEKLSDMFRKLSK